MSQQRSFNGRSNECPGSGSRSNKQPPIGTRPNDPNAPTSHANYKKNSTSRANDQNTPISRPNDQKSSNSRLNGQNPNGHRSSSRPTLTDAQHMEEMQKTIDQTNRRYSQTQQQLNDLIASSPRDRALSRAESDAKDKRIRELEAELVEARRIIDDCRESIRQMQATIKIQSNTIANPKPANTFATPGRPDPRYGPQNSAYMHTAPRYNPTPIGPAPRSIYALNSIQDTPAYSGVPSVQAGRTTHYNQHHTTDQGSPQIPQLQDHSRGSSGDKTNLSTPQSHNVKGQANANGTNQVAQQRIAAVPAPTSTALVRMANPNATAALREQFQKVFMMTEKYAFSHVNLPNVTADSALPQSVKERLTAASSDTAVVALLSNPQTRYFLIAKTINVWLLKHVLRVGAYKGFDLDVDVTLDKAKRQVYQSTPIAVRYLCLSTIANELRSLRSRPGFEEWSQRLIKDRGNQLWAILKPMMHKKTSKDWDDLFLLMVEAHKLVDLMFVGAHEYNLEIPQISMKFQPSMMKNKDPFMQNMSNDQLQAYNAVVKLGVSPLITHRSNTSTGTCTTGTIQIADVLLKWPNQTGF